MRSDETIVRLIDAITAAKPHIAALHFRVGHGDRAAFDRLNALAGAAEQLLDDLDQRLELPGAGLILPASE